MINDAHETLEQEINTMNVICMLYAVYKYEYDLYAVCCLMYAINPVVLCETVGLGLDVHSSNPPPWLSKTPTIPMPL